MDFAVTIDFFDDVFKGRSDWDERTLRALVAGLAERGVSSVHWLDYGRKQDGGRDAGSYFDPDGKGQRFIRAVPDPLAVVCDEAHRHGQTVCAVLKVQDLALGVPAASYPFGAGPNPPTGLPHIGGNGSWALGWLREHPDLRYRLHPALTPSDAGRPIRTLRLWHESATAPDPLPAFQIWVSDDNATYRPYQGPLRLKPSSRRRRPPVFAPAPETRLGPEETFFCLEFAGLELREPFFCIVPEAPVDFANTLAALVEVEDSAGDSVAVTFGFTAVQPYGQAGHDWRRAGISFDTSRRTQLPGRGKKYSAGRDRFTLAERLTGSPNKQTAPAGCPEAEWVVLGMARGRNLYLTGLVDFAYETVHHCLHTMLERALDAGVDAVDIRSGSHTETLDWENYGFSPVAVAEFQRRYGVDVATQVFDRRAWQTLMGEYYDRFITEAAARVRRRGAKFYAHIMPTMDGLPEWPEGVAWHNQAWNWRNWLKEGLLDGATFKGCRVDSQMFGQVIRLCRCGGQATLLNNKPSGSDKQAGWIEAIEQAAAAGIDTFNLYECAALVQLQDNGKLHFNHPHLWKRIQQTGANIDAAGEN